MLEDPVSLARLLLRRYIIAAPTRCEFASQMATTAHRAGSGLLAPVRRTTAPCPMSRLADCEQKNGCLEYPHHLATRLGVLSLNHPCHSPGFSSRRQTASPVAGRQSLYNVSNGWSYSGRHHSIRLNRSSANLKALHKTEESSPAGLLTNSVAAMPCL